MGKTLLTERAVVLAKLQAAVGTPAVPSPITDALLASEPDYSIDPTVLERNFTRQDLSPFPHLIGRKLASFSFTAEVRGNGRQSSGEAVDQPVLARLLAACGYELLEMDGSDANVAPVVPDAKNPATTPEITWAASGTLEAAVTSPVLYTLSVGAGGSVTIKSNNPAVDDLGASGTAGGTLTSGTAIDLGNSGFSVTPTFTGTVPSGAVFRVLVLPKGLKMKPISDNQPAITVEGYFDGLKHRLTDAHGTFTINAEAGNYATIEFTFTGQYHPTVDEDMPTNAVYETTLPSQVELANLTWGSNRELVVNAFTFDQANNIVPRPDVNGSDGYRGVRITSRAPEGGIDPEATLEADAPMWADFAAATAKHFVMNIGTQPGNTVVVHGPWVQTNELGYGDRDGIRTYDLGVLFKRFNGDDEVLFYFV